MASRRKENWPDWSTYLSAKTFPHRLRQLLAVKFSQARLMIEKIHLRGSSPD
jgi:hypothetical protein